MLETLRGPWTCFDASLYSVLILPDLEEEIWPAEMEKLESDMRGLGLSVFVIADWFDEISLNRASFYDEDTRSKWYPVTAGANVPALNTFLERFGAKLGDRAFKGSFTIGDHKVCVF